MSRFGKLLQRVLSGEADANISFAQLCQVLRRLGFQERIRGSHHIFTREGTEEILNLQPRENKKAKAYQVEQVRNVIVRYGLGSHEDA
jgi:predicted RNA binding protein YcfA (HicA-like mRNA interferase family)